MAYAFLRAFARDRAIDEDELAFITLLAERGSVIDEDERVAANRILRRISRDMVPGDVWVDMERFKRRVGV